jgi:hypothetical protein
MDHMTDPWYVTPLLILLGIFLVVLVVATWRNITAKDAPHPFPEPEPLVPGPYGYRVWQDGAWFADVLNPDDTVLHTFLYGIPYPTESDATRAARRITNARNRAVAARRTRETAPIVRATGDAQ